MKISSFFSYNLASDREVKFSARTLKGQLDGVRIQAETLINKTTKGLIAAPATGMMIHRAESSSRGLLSGTHVKQNVGQEVMVATTLDVDKIVTLGAKLKLISTELGAQVTVDNVYETAKRELTSWQQIETKTTGIPAPVLMVGALALTIATGGSGASGMYSAIQGLMAGNATAGAALAASGFKVLCSQIGANFVANGGNVEGAVKNTFSDKGMISLAAQIASAGVLDKLGVVASKTGTSLPQLVDYGARRAAVNAGINVAFGRENVGDAFRNAGVNFIADVVGQVGANKIGSLYNNGDNGQIDFVTHKVLHAGLGAGLGALKGDVAAGALGGFVSELVADITRDDVQEIAARVIERAEREGVNRQDPQIQSLINDELKSTMSWGKVASVVTAALAKRDVNIALDVATNAVENNFAFVIGARILAEIAKPVIVRTVGGSLAVLAGKKASDAVNEYDAHPEDAEWVDEGVSTEEARARPLTTPMPENHPTLRGYEAHAASSSSSDGGFQAHDAPDTSVLTSDDHEIFKLLKEDITKIYKHDRFGKFYKNKEDKLYYTKDQAGHGGSAWKVYRETGRGLEWLRDIDQFGEKMDKHKGGTGKFIPKAELNGVNGK